MARLLCLSQRDKEALTLASLGYRYRDMIDRLGFISEAAVKARMKHIFELLGAETLTQAVATAIRKGLIE